MPYVCLSGSVSRPEPPAGFMDAREFTNRLQGTPDQPAFAQRGVGYTLVTNRPVSVEWQLLDDETDEAVESSWTYLKVQFAPDLDMLDTIVAEQEFPVLDAGTPAERFAGIMSALEINKLTVGEWYMARLITSSGDALAHCPFYVVGGVK